MSRCKLDCYGNNIILKWPPNCGKEFDNPQILPYEMFFVGIFKIAIHYVGTMLRKNYLILTLRERQLICFFYSFQKISKLTLQAMTSGN